MADTISGLSEQEMADLCALADGTLKGDRRAQTEARVAASPDLQALVERQRIALTATLALVGEPVPASLAAGLEGRSRPRQVRRSRERVALVLATAGVLAAVLVTFIVLSLGGGPAAPSIADAAQLAAKPPSGPPPAAVAGTMRLAADVQGLAFPDLSKEFGWRAVGMRQERLDGRDATVVYYAKADRRVGYAIVARPALPLPGEGVSTKRDGVEFRALSFQGRPVVTWRRLGHTCVMIGDVTRGELLALASWDEGGSEAY